MWVEHVSDGVRRSCLQESQGRNTGDNVTVCCELLPKFSTKNHASDKSPHMQANLDGNFS